MVIVMKPILMFVLETCPYCTQALKWMTELREENPEYASIEVNIIDEDKQPDLAKTFNYYYVPTYYIEEEKVHEGIASKEKIKAIFDKAIE
jgi:glutaredoxin